MLASTCCTGRPYARSTVRPPLDHYRYRYLSRSMTGGGGRWIPKACFANNGFKFPAADRNSITNAICWGKRWDGHPTAIGFGVIIKHIASAHGGIGLRLMLLLLIVDSGGTANQRSLDVGLAALKPFLRALYRRRDFSHIAHRLLRNVGVDRLHRTSICAI